MAYSIPIDNVESVKARFWAKVDIRLPEECWPWLGGKGSATANGRYGRFAISHSQAMPAHRAAWELANGRPIPEGMVACHSCDNPFCVNPSHIWIGTQSDNIRDAVAKGRHASVKREYCDQGHLLTPETRTKSKGSCLECARRYTRECMRRVRERKKAAKNQERREHMTFTVSQEDREAVAWLNEQAGFTLEAERTRRGERDDRLRVQAFARHRSTAAAAERARRDWQPIETAPRDEYVLLCGFLDGPHDPRMKLGYWWSEERRWRIDGASWRPVYWMPLPAPPADAIERGEV